MKKKLLFVINTLGHAGAEMALLELLKKLDKEKYEISLYVLMGQGELADRLPDHVKIINRDYDHSSVLTKEGSRKMYGTVLKAMFCRGTVFRLAPYLLSILYDMIKQHKIRSDKLLWRVLSDGGSRILKHYDLAVAYLEGGSAYYVADHVNADKKAAFIHIDYGRAGYTRKMDKDCYLSYDAIFPIADKVKTQFLKVYPECRDKTRVFENIIDQDRIRKKALLPGGFSDNFSGIRILTVGRLNDQKAYPVAIEAMRLLKKEDVPARWYVLGEGRERPALEKQIKDAGLSEDFLLLGAVDNPYPYYAQTDLYVHATRYEGKSIAIQEAQTLGCAIIVSDTSGNGEQIIDGTDGLLCRLDPADIKERVLSLIRDEKKRRELGENAAKRQISGDQQIALLTELLDK